MDLDKAPNWFISALQEIGTREIGDNSGAAIQRYCDLAHCGQQGEPWCAIFVNAMLELNHIQGTRSPASHSFLNNPLFDEIELPVLGCIAVFWRGTVNSGLGHVGFYRGEYGDHVLILGGNENDMVQTKALPKAGESFGLIGYCMPHGTDPDQFQQGPIIMPEDAAPHVTDAPKVV